MATRRRVLTRLLRAERDGSLYAVAGGASLAGAAAFVLMPMQKQNDMQELPPRKPAALTEAERRAAAERANSEQAGFVQWALSTAAEAESVHNDSTTAAQRLSSTIREGNLMARAPRQAWGPAQSGAAVAADSTQTVTTLGDVGLCRVDKCLSEGAAAELLTHINGTLAAHARASRAAGAAQELDSERFGDVLSPTARWDLKLTLAPPVVAAMREARLSPSPSAATPHLPRVRRRHLLVLLHHSSSQALAPLQPVLEHAVGPDAVLHECAALVADPHVCQPARPPGSS